MINAKACAMGAIKSTSLEKQKNNAKQRRNAKLRHSNKLKNTDQDRSRRFQLVPVLLLRNPKPEVRQPSMTSTGSRTGKYISARSTAAETTRRWPGSAMHASIVRIENITW